MENCHPKPSAPLRYNHHYSVQHFPPDIVAHFSLTDRMQPFTRCSDCNTPLAAVAKADIVHRLEPLTKAHYQRFARCPACDKLFWGGSHVADMRARL